MTPQAVFFDFDGVLADSMEVKTRAFARLYADCGPEVQARVVDHHRNNGGMSRFEKFTVYAREFLGRELGDGESEALCSRFAAIVVEEVVAAPEIPGAEAFLDACRDLDCYVVSGTPQDEIREICLRRGLDGRFARILGSPVGKAEHVRAVLAERGYDPARCLFFGDASADYEAARQNDVPFLGIVPGPDAPLVARHPEVTWFPDFNALAVSGRVSFFRGASS
ncbi:hypothetical protein JCM15519_17600 [Fundidesulfovibrio butyratiphilus]